MKRWITGILCVSCLLMMTACSRNGEEVSGSQEESSQTMESSSESVEQPSEDSQPEETAEPEEPVSSRPRTVSIRPVTSAEAEPVQVNVTARNAIAAEMVVVSDGQKAAEFAAELQSVVPSDQPFPAMPSRWRSCWCTAWTAVNTATSSTGKAMRITLPRTEFCTGAAPD